MVMVCACGVCFACAFVCAWCGCGVWGVGVGVWVLSFFVAGGCMHVSGNFCLGGMHAREWKKVFVQRIFFGWCAV